MQGRKTFTPKMLYAISLQELVPENNFYRRLLAALDLHWLYKETADYYGMEGQESIDPVVFFKICMVGYINNIASDRKLIEFCADSLAIRLFLGYDIDESLPWHSTISRTRQLYGEEVFQQLFKDVLKQCIDKGMVAGRRQVMDSVAVKANASMDSLIAKEILDDTSTYADELKEGEEKDEDGDNSNKTVSAARNKAVQLHHKWKAKAYKDMPRGKSLDKGDEGSRPKFVSNHTHYSSTDADARVSVKPGKPRQLNYAAQISVDTAHHVITQVQTDFADKRDSQCLPSLLNNTLDNLQQQGLQVEEVYADTGYSSGCLLYTSDAADERSSVDLGGRRI